MLKTHVFIDIWFVKQDINSWFTRTIQFYMENLKIKIKRAKKNWPSRAGILTQDLRVWFPPMIWNFTGSEGDGIKSRQPPKRDRTLQQVSIQNENKKRPRIILELNSSQLSKWANKCCLHHWRTDWMHCLSNPYRSVFLFQVRGCRISRPCPVHRGR